MEQRIKQLEEKVSELEEVLKIYRKLLKHLKDFAFSGPMVPIIKQGFEKYVEEEDSELYDKLTG